MGETFDEAFGDAYQTFTVKARDGRDVELAVMEEPVTREGLKAIRLLSERGVSVTATCIYTRMQAFLAGKAGAV